MDFIDWDDINDINDLNGRRQRNRTRIDPFTKYDDEEFKTKYRFSKVFVIHITNLIKEDIQKDKRGGGISPEIQTATALRYWAKSEIQDDAGDLQGLSQQAVSNIARNVATALASKAHQFINMPQNIEEELSSMQSFEAISGFKQVIGAIDCTHIRLNKVGGEQAQYYINRKGYYSLNVQVVCDAHLKIRDIVARWRGSTHDSRIFNESRLKSRMECGEFHGRLLGDSGYACTNYLFTPILTPQNAMEERYNEAQIRTRNTVERCFGVWKQRFRCLLKGLNVGLETAKTTIIALAVLHNIALEMNETSQEDNFITPGGNDSLITESIGDNNLRGNLARQQFIYNNF